MKVVTLRARWFESGGRNGRPFLSGARSRLPLSPSLLPRELTKPYTHTRHTQVSDAILDACLEQDPDPKVRQAGGRRAWSWRDR